MNWLKNILLNLIASVLFVVGASAFAYLRASKEMWAPIILYGLGGGCLMVLLFVAFLGIRRFAELKPLLKITHDNVEYHIKNWLDNFGMSVQRQKTDDAYFSFKVTLPNGNHVAIQHLKQLKQYLLLSIAIIDTHQVLSKLPPQELDHLLTTDMLEAARSLTTFERSGLTILLSKRLPISPELREGKLIDIIEQLNSTTVAIQIINTQALARHGIANIQE
ncbi:MAG: DUF2299 family protein [Syntrophobacteraceae bacterium]|jgi:hypothetical protein